VTRVAEKRSACRVLVGKSEGKTASWKIRGLYEELPACQEGFCFMRLE
jgi:hypothetical protein